jgi:4-amino-4-deoxy-L-arabinose transferase-like glycosyltransferase
MNRLRCLTAWIAALSAAACAGIAPAAAQESGWVEQEIRYVAPAAGAVEMAWGVDGWTHLPETERPAGTYLHDNVMHTPMAREADAFTLRCRVPRGAVVDYGFLVTHRADGSPILPVWLEGSTRRSLETTRSGSATVEAAASDLRAIEQARRLPTWAAIWFWTMLGLNIVLAVGLGLTALGPAPSPRAVALTLLTLTLAAIALRLLMVTTVERLLSPAPVLNGDEKRYVSIAMDIVNGRWFPWPGSTPFYPVFLAACYKAFGPAHAPALMIQAVLASAAVPLTYLLARRFTGARSALFASWLVAAHPGLIAHANSLYTEALYTPLVVLSLLGLCRLWESPTLRRNLAAGAWLGLITLCRPATATLPAALLFIMPRRWGWARRLRAAAVLLAVIALMVAPNAYHNWRRHGAVLPFGLSLTMLWHGSPEFYHVMETTPNAMLKVWDRQLNPDWNGGHDPMTIEGDRYFNARAVAAIRAEPWLYVKYSLQKLAFFWVGHPAAVYDWPFDARGLRRTFGALEIAGLFGARLLFVLAALASLWVLRRRLREFAVLLFFCAYLMGVHAVLVPVARYSEPLYPALAVLIAAAAGDLLKRWAAARGLPRPAFAVHAAHPLP